MNDFPKEVRSPPLVLAALLGAVPVHQPLTEALHESSITACGQKRVKCLSFSYDMRIPPSKRGGKDVPGYEVCGLVKKRWLEKICNEVPSTLVVCFDWSEEPLVSQADESQALSHLQHARRQARDRELRVLLFAVLHADVSDPEAQCSALRMQPEGSGLVIARGTADIAAKAQKLERLVYQNGLSFYADEEKRHRKVQPMVSTMPGWMQSALHVRANFKLGFLSEFRRDTRSALKHYIKAYEQLIKDASVADVVERMSLCSHITIRMYQLYLQSHDISAAVHHCRIHAAFLRSYSPSEELLAWRRWYGLTVNHQLFAELLESVVQQMPVLIDQADLWQFSGFHYQCAATYAMCLREWGKNALESLSTDSSCGGDLVPAPFVGQNESLERPDECASAIREVNLRRALQKATDAVNGDQCLQLLTRAQVACKERGYTAGVVVCTARMAEEYMSKGNVSAAVKLYEKARRRDNDAKNKCGHWTAWPALHQFSLQQSIKCSCHELGLVEIPSICRSSSSSESEMQSGSENITVASMSDISEGQDTICQRLLMDAFEYMTTFLDQMTVPQQAELLETVRAAVSKVGSEALQRVQPIPFDAAGGHVEFQANTSNCQTFHVVLHSPLATPLKMSRAVASTSCGDIMLSCAADTSLSSLEWKVGCPVELTGTWTAEPPAVIPHDFCISMVCVTLDASCGEISLAVKRLCRRGDLPPLASEFKLPASVSLQTSSHSELPPNLNRPLQGVKLPEPSTPPIRAEMFLPVDSTTAMLHEYFVLHVATFARPSDSLNQIAGEIAKLWMSCSVQVQDDHLEGNIFRTGDFAASLLGKPVEGSVDGRANVIPLSMDEAKGRVVAEVQSAQLKPVEPVVALFKEHLADGPLTWKVDEEPLIIPIVVRSSRECRALLSISVCLRSGTGDAIAATVKLPPVALYFRQALQTSFEDRPSGAGSSPLPRMPRRFSIKSTAQNGIELKSVCFVQDTVGSLLDIPENAKSNRIPALGILDRVAPGSSHAFALPPSNRREPEGRLLVSFQREQAIASFFPFPSSLKALHEGAVPDGSAEWPLPKEPLGVALPANSLTVDLEHGSTGMVAEPLEVKVCVRRGTPGAQEYRVRIIQGESGDGSDRFFISGPTNTQNILMAAREAEIGSSFHLIPLRPGWLTLPRVQVSCGAHEATSMPSSIFVFPAKQPIVWRSVG